DLDGTRGEGNSSFSGPGTSDDVRLKFTSHLTLPSNANTISISLPVGVAIDNQFVSIKVNGVENLVPTPAANPIAADYGTLKSVNITKGWQAGVNTIEVVVDSGPDRVGFLLAIQATTTQVCTNPNVVLVKRITRINTQNLTNIVDGRSDVSPNAANYVASPRDIDDDSTNPWPSGYLRGLINGGIVKPGDELEYTIYFLSNGLGNATNVKICDLIPTNTTFLPTAFNGMTPNDGGLPGADQGIALGLGSSTPTAYLTNAQDGDRGRFYTANESGIPSSCGININGAVVVNITRSSDLPNLPASTGTGTPANSYGFVRFRVKVK
ncbi:MAG: hypothetical protein ACYTXY_08735, partial [Nostoc sp.]